MKRTKAEQVKRYLIFFSGPVCKLVGRQPDHQGKSGNFPYFFYSYVLSLNFPFSLGNFTIVFSLLLIFLQFLLLGKNFKAEHLLQIPVSMAFGYFIDMSMILLGFVHPVSYISKVLGLLIGCLVLGVGVYMEVLADVVMLPGESFVRAVVFRIHSEFGFTKVCFDVSMAVIAAVLSFLLSGHLEGVREGTIVAAVLVGFIARSIENVFLSFLCLFTEMIKGRREDRRRIE